MSDFESAFDRVPPASSILKFMKIGIKWRMLKFIDAFHQNRKIQTKPICSLSQSSVIFNRVP